MCLLTMALAGCGTAAVERVEVVGEVTLDGDPVEQAHVYLTAKVPHAAGKSFVGTYAAMVLDGTFEFPLQAGPPPGEYELIVMPVEPDSEEVFTQVQSREPGLLAERNRLQAAANRKGPIRVELTSDDVNELTIELTTR